MVLGHDYVWAGAQTAIVRLLDHSSLVQSDRKKGRLATCQPFGLPRSSLYVRVGPSVDIVLAEVDKFLLTVFEEV